MEKQKNKIIPPEELLTPDQLAQKLKVQKSWVYWRTRDAEINGFPVVRVGRYVRFRYEDVLDYLSKNQESRGMKL